MPTHLLPPSSETLLPDSTMRPAYRPRRARRSRFLPVRYVAPDAMAKELCRRRRGALPFLSAAQIPLSSAPIKKDD